MGTIKRILQKKDFESFKMYIEKLVDINEPSLEFGCELFADEFGGYFYYGESARDYEHIYQNTPAYYPLDFEWTLIQLVCAFGYEEFLILVLEKGANCNFIDYCQRNCFEICHYLSKSHLVNIILIFPFWKLLKVKNKDIFINFN